MSNGTSTPADPAAGDSASRLPALWKVLAVVSLVWLVAGTTVWLSFADLPSRGQFGDMFGAVNALFSGLAMAGVIYAVFLQREELSLQRQELKAQREEMSKMVATQVRQLHISIQSLAMECDDIAKVWAFNETTDLNFRQSAYVNLVLSNWEMQFGEGLLTPSQVTTTLSKYFAESKQFRAFWAVAGTHRKAMAEASGGTALEFHTLAQSAYNSAPKA